MHRPAMSPGLGSGIKLQVQGYRDRGAGTAAATAIGKDVAQSDTLPVPRKDLYGWG